MQVIDFSQSFVTFRVDTLKKPSLTTSHKPPFSLNNARIQLDCSCEIKDKRTNHSQQFVLGASCKTEYVGVERGIWTEPNADFVPIYSRDRFMNVKTFDRTDRQVSLYPPTFGLQPERQVGQVAEAFDSVRIEVSSCNGEPLETPKEIVESFLTNQRIVARTEIEIEHYVAVIEYPVKTMNVNERDWIYQTDTGPILLPGFTENADDLIGTFELAFAAFNSPGWVEFIVRAKTPVAQDVSVYHYCKPVRFDSKNQLIRLGC